MATPPDDLTPDQERFVEEYLIDLNATQAYRRAFPGCTYKTARSEGSRFLAKPSIVLEVQAAKQERRRQSKVKADKVIRELARIAFADIGAACDLSADEVRPLPPRQIPLDTRRAMTTLKLKRRRVLGNDEASYEVEVFEYRFADKVAALDKLARHLGLFQEKAPLEVILAALPDELREQVRAALAAAVFAGGSDVGDPGAGGQPELGPVAVRPDPPVQGDGMGAGPLAEAVPEQHAPPVGAPVLPPGGEERRIGGEDTSPLFDP